MLQCSAMIQGEWFKALETRGWMSDELLFVQRLHEGDHAAFSALYDRHAALVYGVAKRILSNAAQAEDVTQSVFLQLWSNPTAFRGGNFVGWLARVAKNAALDILRSSAVRTREPEMPQNMPSDVAIEDEVFMRLQGTAISNAVAALPPDQRTAIEQAYFGGLSYREVAERLDTPVGTVKSRIRAGLRRLWNELRVVAQT